MLVLLTFFRTLISRIRLSTIYSTGSFFSRFYRRRFDNGSIYSPIDRPIDSSAVRNFRNIHMNLGRPLPEKHDHRHSDLQIVSFLSEPEIYAIQ